MAITVKVEAFEGPLDLLLQLIEKNKVNIYDIPIALITDQYMEALHAMEHLDLDAMSDFLLMAATLLSIKARMMLPVQKDENDEEIDPREELVRRLLEYKMYKYISRELRDKEFEAGFQLYKQATIPAEVEDYREPVDPGEVIAHSGVDAQKLYDTFEQVMRRSADKIDPVRSRFGRIEREEVSVAEKMTYVRRYLHGHRKMRFRDLLQKGGSRTEVVVTFLCVLELMKVGAIRLRQETLFSEIDIEYLGREDEPIDIGSEY
ncbi:MAG: segregation/condensation protein A [Lachnospiraceae bacterium]|nr:segregation/condensation protein A [Lachnospiraceae bacterium]